jgi:two-component system, OmpR family, sensor histidine kinase KdpD
VTTREESIQLGSSTPTRTVSSAGRHQPAAFAVRRLRPEFVALAGAAVLAFAFSYRFHWPWFTAILVGLLIAGVALVMYGLVLRAARDAREADLAALRIRRLYELTRRTLDMDLHEEPGPRLASLVHEIFELDAVAVFDADLQEVYRAGHWSIDPTEMVQNVYHFGSSDDDRATGISRRVIRLGSVPIGSLVVRGDTTPLANSAIAALIAITFDRYGALANETRIEAEREAEQLRATVLDSLAHDFKTPLTAIRAASTGLSEMGRLSPAQAEMVALIDEQATLLADLTTRLLTAARPEPDDSGEAPAGGVLHRAPERVDELIEESLESLADRSAAARVEIEVPQEPLVLDCDRRLVGMLLAQYLDNACKYAEFDSTITVRAEKNGEEIVLSVHSFGPMIPMADRERIFDRYFRSSASSSHTAGTGIGLSIAKRAALAHGGSVWVSSDEAEGNTFFAALPAAQSLSSLNSEHSSQALERSIS